MQASCQTLPGVGAKLAQALAKAGVHTLFQLLQHLPLRYQDRTRLTPINRLHAEQYALIRGTIEHVEVSFRKRKMLLVYVNDGSGVLLVRFFKFFQSQRMQLQVGALLQCYAQVKRVGLQAEMAHPDYQVLHPEHLPDLEKHLTPVYPAIKGVAPAVLRKIITACCEMLRQQLEDYLPDALRQHFSLGSIWQLFYAVHRVAADTPLMNLQKHTAMLRHRLAFDELLAHQLSLNQYRDFYQSLQAVACNEDQVLKQRFLKDLPFALTSAQARVLQEIESDLCKAKPMMRLVQGDVGSGKTIVAALSALPVLAEGLQVAIMAPTEILAEQHYTKFLNWFSVLGFSVTRLLSKLKAKQKREVLADISDGRAQVIVGTHALFQKQVQFQQLGLIVIDEQHRFGVHQRLSLRDKGVLDKQHPHQLIMTATPIPRTLAMCAYADLDQSVIDELPPGRKPITTIAIDNRRRLQVIERIRSVCASGRQVYWVCTLIETSDVLQCEACEKTFETLESELGDLRVAMIHGRLHNDEKQETMQRFVQGDIDVLVATTVIEVGVDVPNASLMIIENAERLGLSQLHQLRGRIGRGEYQSFCVLLFQSPLGEVAKKRIEIMRETQDGFVVAEKDLAIRGPGEFLGTRQAGSLEFRFADIDDQRLLNDVQLAAGKFENKKLMDEFLSYWQADRNRYAQV